MKLLFTLALATGLFAQEFDVSSVKPVADPTQIASGDIKYVGGTLYMDGVSLGYAIRWAYNIQPYELGREPRWIWWNPTNTQPRYFIQAKTSPTTTKAEARLMAQKLLAERFGLTFHYEEKMLNAFILTEAPGGVKIQRVEGNNELAVMGFVPPDLTFKNIDMRELCEDLSQTVQAPVIDRTSLGDQKFNASASVVYEPGKGEMVSALIFGLRKDMGFLTTRDKVTIKVMIVDTVNQKPTEN